MESIATVSCTGWLLTPLEQLHQSLHRQGAVTDRTCNLGQNLGTEQCSIQLTAKCHWVDPEIFQYTFCEFINILEETNPVRTAV